jgi:hypothetical protein
MKVIKFNTTDQVNFDALAYKIHNALLTSEIQYSADNYATFSKSPLNTVEDKVGLIIVEDTERYNVIFSCLTTDEQNAIETVSEDWGSQVI